MKVLLFLLLGLIVSACASQTDTTESLTVSAIGEPTEPRDVVCTKEKPTGSNRPVTVCRPALDEVDREDTQRDMRILQNQSDLLKR